MLRFFKYLLPHWLFVLESKRRFKKSRKNWLAISKLEDDQRFNDERTKRNQKEIHPFDYQDVIQFLLNKGIPRLNVIEGSIPENSLLQIANYCQERFSGKKVFGIHVGNFLGVSLANITHACKEIHEESIVVAIDPNIPHRGVQRPNEVCSEVLSRYGLEDYVLFVQGYSLQKSFSNDGVNYDEVYDPKTKFAEEVAASNQLRHLSRLSPGIYDFILFDGNHNSNYLLNEIKLAKSLLKNGGLIILDDVDQNWPTIKDIYENNEDVGLTQVFTDGRIGILEKKEG
jgi:Methyltransferase domain